jgi:hypothetical protein
MACLVLTVSGPVFMIRSPPFVSSTVLEERMKRMSWRLAATAVLVGGTLAGCAGTRGNLPGGAAPAFSLPSLGGEEVSLAAFAGGPVLLYFHMAVG